MTRPSRQPLPPFSTVSHNSGSNRVAKCQPRGPSIIKAIYGAGSQCVLPLGGSFQSRGSGLGNSPIRWPAYHSSPVARSRRPTWPDGGSSRLQRGHTGSITRRHSPVADFTVSAHRPKAGRPQKMHFTRQLIDLWHVHWEAPNGIVLYSTARCVCFVPISLGKGNWRK
jgi:hypothetical protein